jgi:potassium-transporting ATPase KdpC subunit
MKNIAQDIITSILATLLFGIVLCGIYPLLIWGAGAFLFPHQTNGSLLEDSSHQLIGSALIGQNFTSAKYFQSRPSAAGTGYDATSSGGSNLGPTSKKFIDGTTKSTTLPPKVAGGPLLPGPDIEDFDGIQLRVVSYCDANNIPYQLLQADRVVDPKIFKTEKGDYDPVKLITAFNDSAKPLIVKPSMLLPGDAVTASGSGLDPHISPKNARLQAARVAKERNLSLDVVSAEIEKATDHPTFGILGDPGVNVLKLNLSLDHLAAK